MHIVSNEHPPLRAMTKITWNTPPPEWVVDPGHELNTWKMRRKLLKSETILPLATSDVTVLLPI